mgnify:CR=1 FL=1
MAARILVVDDDLDTVNLLRLVLQRAGYKVITASSLEEVIDRVKLAEQYHEYIDLVILDLIMPGRSGYQCMERLIEINPEARIIVASGYMEMEGWGSELLSQARFIVRKPYEMRDLLQLIRKALDETG